MTNSIPNLQRLDRQPRTRNIDMAFKALPHQVFNWVYGSSDGIISGQGDLGALLEEGAIECDACERTG